MLKEVISKPLLRKHGVETWNTIFKVYKINDTFFVCVNCKFDLRALGEGHGDIKINNSGKNAAILWYEERNIITCI